MSGEIRNSPAEREKLQSSLHVSEDETPEHGLPRPVLSPRQWVALEKWKIDRVLRYQSFISLAAIVAASLVPNTAARFVVLAVWIGATKLTRRLLTRAFMG